MLHSQGAHLDSLPDLIFFAGSSNELVVVPIGALVVGSQVDTFARGKVAMMSPRRKSGGGRKRDGRPFLDSFADDSCDNFAENKWAAGVVLLRLATGLSEAELETVSSNPDNLHEVRFLAATALLSCHTVHRAPHVVFPSFLTWPTAN